MSKEFTPRMEGPYTVEADPCSELHTWYFVKDSTGHRFARVLYRSEANQIASSMENHDALRASIASLHSILERVAVDNTDLLTSDEHVQWMEAGALLNRLKSHAASTEK